MTKYIDLLITDDDLTLDVAVQPLLISDRASIAQDVKHLVRESGLLVQIIGERDVDAVKTILNRIETLVENDVRIVPGTARVTRTDVETIFITADTQEYGPVEVTV
ncbi:DUF2590 family protein [Pseudomaricurvus alkylphenolicus]|uniref:DUF2590 family protein n=1 Tax=Pseudomaricurvus alkylphenolicus TaxID=1306991 RepID=UPI00141F7ED2|nr:DUF2590 family protein [Pseudomaricurvus alkylphenolicus]